MTARWGGPSLRVPYQDFQALPERMGMEMIVFLNEVSDACIIIITTTTVISPNLVPNLM